MFADRPGRIGELVAILDQKPGICTVTRAVHLHKREKAAQLLAGKREDDLPASNLSAGIITLGKRIPAFIPNDDAASAVLTLRNHALEQAVSEGMFIDGPFGMAHDAKMPSTSSRKS
jgi:hypothetical protein